MTRPNVLLLTVDDMNGDTPGCFGGPVLATPNIDALAAEGMRFVRAHVTVAVCQPSRSVLMTGRFPHRNGAEGFGPIRSDVPVLTDALRATGYRCGILGKVEHLAPVERFAWDTAVSAAELGIGRDPVRYGVETRAFLDRAGDSPWFLMANTHDPHRPFAGSTDEAIELGEGLAGVPPPSHRFGPDDWHVPGFLPDLPAIREETAQYLSSSRRADDSVGAILRAVDGAGQRDQTIVVFLSDNGMAFPFAKSNCYLHSTRTPLIVRWPGVVPAGAADHDHYVAGHDLLPTICHALAIESPAGLDGRSFLDVLTGRSDAARDEVVTVYHENVLGMRFEMRCVQSRHGGDIWNHWSDGQRRYQAENMSGLTWREMQSSADPAVATRCELYERRVPEELYDLECDPDALVDLATEPESAALLTAMRARLRAHLHRVDDPLAVTFDERYPA
jgi:N-sulfoglucosamine sulfohydrolase